MFPAKLTTLLAAAPFLAPVLFGQSEGALKQAFEGKEVIVRVEMPETKYGIDVTPESTQAVDFKLVGNRLRQYGVAFHRGDSTTVTLIKVNKKSIEFQLGGGGYGTFADALRETSNNPAPSAYVPKSRREQQVEREYKATGNSDLKRELDDLKDRRDREQRRIQAEAATARVMQRQDAKDAAAESGSRFNIKFQNYVPPDALEPARLAEMLHQYLDFPDMEEPEQHPTVSSFSAKEHIESNHPPNPALLRKGMSEQEVIDHFGLPRTRNIEEAGGLELVHTTHQVGESTLTADFVGGVLVKYTLSAD